MPGRVAAVRLVVAAAVLQACVGSTAAPGGQAPAASSGGAAALPAGVGAPGGGTATTPAAAGSPGSSSAASALPPAPEPLVYGYANPAATQWFSYVAQARGYFAEQALAVESVTTGAATVSIQGLISGSLEIINSSPDPPIRAAAGGADLVIVSNMINPPIYSLYAQRDLTRVEQLRGKTLIAGGPKDITLYFLDRMLTPNGLRREDYSLVYAGGTPDRLRALQSGAVDAAILSQPSEFVARREGYSLVMDTYEYVRTLPFATLSTTRAWLEQADHRQRAVRFLAAVYRGAQDVCDPAQKEAMIRVLAEGSGLSDEDARLTYALLLEEKRSVKCDLRVTADDLQHVVDYLTAMGDMEPPGPDLRRIADPSYLEQATARAGR
jgi:ABC-type nitrate/sulfonate/bicarbonate transport system substrate-binding protein